MRGEPLVALIIVVVITSIVVILYLRKNTSPVTEPTPVEPTPDVPSIVEVVPNCSTDSDCYGGEVCRDGSCFSTGCFTDSNCSDGYRCRENTCIPPCACTPLENLITTFDTVLVQYWKDSDVQSDGKIVVAGDVFIARFNANGSSDNTFGRDIGFRTNVESFIQDLRVCTDDAIIVYCDDYFLRKFVANGQEYLGFGEAGSGNYSLGNNGIQWKGLMLDPVDDSIFIVRSNLVLKLTPAGAPDNAFGDSGGYVPLDIPDLYQPLVSFTHLNFDSNGKIIVTGQFSLDSLQYPSVGSLRLNANGTLDTSYGTNGYYYLPRELIGYNIDVCNGSIVTSVASIDSDDNVFITSTTTLDYNGGTSCTALITFIIKLNSNGVLDTNFGNDGILYYNVDPAFYNPLQHNSIISPCDQSLLLALSDFGPEYLQGYVLKVSNNGQTVTRYDISSESEPNLITLHSMRLKNGSVYMTGQNIGDPYIATFACD